MNAFSRRLASYFDDIIVYHGTSASNASDIDVNGINNQKYGGGYFGYGFYTVLDKQSAMNYVTEETEESGEPGAILSFRVKPGTVVCDIRIEEEFKDYVRISN